MMALVIVMMAMFSTDFQISREMFVIIMLAMFMASIFIFIEGVFDKLRYEKDKATREKLLKNTRLWK